MSGPTVTMDLTDLVGAVNRNRVTSIRLIEETDEASIFSTRWNVIEFRFTSSSWAQNQGVHLGSDQFGQQMHPMLAPQSLFAQAPAQNPYAAQGFGQPAAQPGHLKNIRLGGIQLLGRDPPPSNFGASMAELFEEGDCSDVIFSVDGTDIPAHRCILSARSPVMKALLTGKFSEGSNPGNKVVIQDVDAMVFKQMLRFIYTDQINSSTDMDMQALLVAADRYEVERLRTVCELHLIERMSAENCCENLIVAKAIKATKLKDAAMEYIVDQEGSTESVLKSRGMKRMAKHNPGIMIQLLSAAILRDFSTPTDEDVEASDEDEETGK